MVKNLNAHLLEIGYDNFFDTKMGEFGFALNSLARVIAEYKEAYRVKNTNGEYLAKITGKHMFTASKREDYPAVGDWVVIDELPDKKAIIRNILPRKTILKKKHIDRQDSNRQHTQIIATNIDIAFIVESMDRDYNLNRFERYFVMAEEGKIQPVIILNKTDLISKNILDLRIEELKNRLNGIDIISTSTLLDQGLSELQNYITNGKTYCFLGSSGVGKSSLINKLLGKDEIKTREINFAIERGRHTTTVRELYVMKNGGIVIDNPGTRDVGIGFSDVGIENMFDEISQMSRECKYYDCTHEHEPGCAILQAIAEKKLDKNKYSNYLKIKKESDFYQMTDLEKREKDRKFGQFIKKAKEQLRNIR